MTGECSIGIGTGSITAMRGTGAGSTRPHSCRFQMWISPELKREHSAHDKRRRVRLRSCAPSDSRGGCPYTG